MMKTRTAICRSILLPGCLIGILNFGLAQDRRDKSKTIIRKDNSTTINQKDNSTTIIWDQPQPDSRKPAAGYPIIKGVEHYSVFKHSIDSGVFNHHARLGYHKGVFYAAWSNCDYFEGSAGQRIMCATSTDGKHWNAFEGVSSPSPPFPQRRAQGQRAKPHDWVIVDGEMYLLGLVFETVEYSPDGYNSTFNGRDGKYGTAGIARKVGPNGQLGPVLWLGDYLHEPFEKFVPNIRTETAKKVLANYLQKYFHTPEPVSYMKWSDFIDYLSFTKSAEGRGVCEPVAYRRDDGKYVTLWRGRGPGESHMYASICEGDDLRVWSKAVKTDIPDAPSQSCGGNLPDGRIALIGNQAKAIGARDPITLSLSNDGVTFYWTGSIRHGAERRASYDNGKTAGFQYPGYVVVGNYLWVMYSITKEDIGISRVPLASLPKN